MTKKVFLTGVTGVVGSSVLPYLLNKTDWGVVVLLRAKNKAAADVRLNGVLDFIEDEISIEVRLTPWRKRVTALFGDLDKKFFGLNKNIYEDLAQSVHHIVHCAASVDLTRPEAEAIQATSFETQQILDLQGLNKGCKLQYVSTVGVNGRRNEALTEKRMTLAESPRLFFNSYEMAKAKSEELVYKAQDHGQNITIHRPSMVVGNSKTGRIIHYQVFYFLLRLVCGLLTNGVVPPLFSRRLDTIPCDFVGRIIFESMTRDDLSGEIIHLCSSPSGSLTLGEIRSIADQVAQEYDLTLPRLKSVPSFIFRLASLGQYFLPKSSKMKKRLELLPQFLAYASQDQNFSNMVTKKRFSNISWPNSKEYLNPVIRNYFQSKTLKLS